MSPSEKVRALLDERGIEYETPHAGFTIVRTNNLVCKFYETLEEPEHGVFAVLTTDWLTPEQAIAATLGEEHETHICKRCGVAYELNILDKGFGKPRFCPNCGARRCTND